MKKEQGVTLTSILVYIIAMVIVIGTIATITSFFYTNVTGVKDNSDNIAEITKFHMCFLEEVKKQNNEIIRLENNTILFSTGNTFFYQDKSIYYNQVRICENISHLQFNVEEVNSKQVIQVLITIGDDAEYTKITQYVLGK